MISISHSSLFNAKRKGQVEIYDGRLWTQILLALRSKEIPLTKLENCFLMYLTVLPDRLRYCMCLNHFDFHATEHTDVKIYNSNNENTDQTFVNYNQDIPEFTTEMRHSGYAKQSGLTEDFTTSNDRHNLSYPKQALLICNSLDTLCYLTNIEEDSKPSNCSCNIDKCEQPSNKAEKKRSTKTKKAQSKPTLADDLINSVDFLLHNNEYLTPQDVNELLDGNTLIRQHICVS
ncbi:hypothetical protein GJ496_002238 [Pomphorhynchus laevis]|nr:hypothetical protein GJ496_002238 [Pomphorhynchus laevis]